MIIHENKNTHPQSDYHNFEPEIALLSMYKLIILLSELMDFVERKSYRHTQEIVHLWVSVILNLDLHRFVFSIQHIISCCLMAFTYIMYSYKHGAAPITKTASSP